MPLVKIADLNQPAEALEPYFDMARSLSKRYDDLLTNWVEDASHRPPGLHASEFSKCVRQGFYSLMSVPKQNSTKAIMRRKFHMGHAIHDMVQRELHKMAALHQAEELAQQNGWYLQFEDEVRLDPATHELAAKYHFHSSCDGIFTFRETEHGDPVLRVGLEIKSENPDSYAELKGPKEDHVKQVHVYMAGFDLPLMWFFYMNKGNQNSTPSSAPWLIPFNPKVWNDLESRANEIIGCAEKGETPRREEGFHCTFCPYAYECNPPSLTQKRRLVSVRRP